MYIRHVKCEVLNCTNITVGYYGAVKSNVIFFTGVKAHNFVSYKKAYCSYEQRCQVMGRHAVVSFG